MTGKMAMDTDTDKNTNKDMDMDYLKKIIFTWKTYSFESIKILKMKICIPLLH